MPPTSQGAPISRRGIGMWSFASGSCSAHLPQVFARQSSFGAWGLRTPATSEELSITGTTVSWFCLVLAIEGLIRLCLQYVALQGNACKACSSGPKETPTLPWQPSFLPWTLRLWGTGVAVGATSGDLHPSFPERQPGTATSTAPTCASIGRVWRQKRRHWHLLRRGSFCTKDALSPRLSAGRPVGRCAWMLIS